MAKLFLSVLASICILEFLCPLICAAPNEVLPGQTYLNEGQNDIVIEDAFIQTTKSLMPVPILINGTYHTTTPASIIATLKVAESLTVRNYTFKFRDGEGVHGPFEFKSVGRIDRIGGGFKRQHFQTWMPLKKNTYAIDKLDATIVTNEKTLTVSYPFRFTFLMAR